MATLTRRSLLAVLAAGTAWPAHADAPPQRLGVAWREPDRLTDRQTDREAGHHLGILQVDWAAATLRVIADRPVPSRPHGLLAEPGGTLLAVALRPGRWLLRLDATGRVLQHVDIAGESLPRRFGGHVAASADGTRLYTTETDTRTGLGRIGVRDARTLRRVDDWDSGGVEPHQLLLDPQGHLVVANGGIWRDRDDRKIQPGRMDSSLVRLHGEAGTPLGQWRLADPRLSLRHLAWGADGRLGVALQAEHDVADRRDQAPALAVWDGQALHTVPGGQGYAGEITAAPEAAGGGFVLSNAMRDQAWWWSPRQEAGVEIARLQRAYALATAGGVLIAAARGLARWHPAQAPRLLPWPQPMALDNHMVVLQG